MAVTNICPLEAVPFAAEACGWFRSAAPHLERASICPIGRFEPALKTVGFGGKDLIHWRIGMPDGLQVAIMEL